MNRLIDDGDFSTAKARNQATPSFPFCNYPVPDVYARMFRREYAIRPANFRPATATRTSYTNMLVASNTFSDSAWTKTRSDISNPATPLTPDGIAPWKITEDTTAAETHWMKQDVTFTPSTNYVRYMLAKAGERFRIELCLRGAVNVARGFDLVSGTTFANTISVSAPTAYGMVALEDGWFLCWLSQTMATGTSVETYLNNGSTTTYDGDGTSGVFISYDHLLAMANSPLKPIIRSFGGPFTISSPLLDPGDELRPPDPFAYLVEESDPRPDAASRFVWDRTFARIPGQQVTPGSLTITKPALSGSFPQRLGGYIVFQLDPSLFNYDAYFNFPVQSDTGTPSFPTTGGTYTLTFDGDTTGPLNYNDSAGTVETEINLLPSIIARGGCTVSRTFDDPDGFLVEWNDYATCTIDSSLLTISGGSIFDATTSINNGYMQIPQLSAFPNTFTGGTWTITVFGQTTGPIDWNATLADVQAELDLLSEVTARGGCIVSGDPFNGGFAINPSSTVISCTFTFSNPVFTGDASSLTPVDSQIIGGPFNPIAPVNQNIRLVAPAVRTIVTLSPHGMTTDSSVFIRSVEGYFTLVPATFVIVDEYTIQLTVQASYAYATISTITDTGRLTKAGYAPGTVTVRTSKVRDFYLPGVTTGISSATDIPIPTSQSENSLLLEAIFSGTGTINWSVGNVEQWKGPILSLEKTTIQAADL